jgi:Zn-dependent protease with chaperone function
MNFFKRQDETRRASRRLIVLFVVAVIAVVVAIDALVALVFANLPRKDGPFLTVGEWISAHPMALVSSTLIALAVISIASIYKTAMLSGGGGVVARSLGGVRVARDTSDPLQRRLLNVVEEMAIASGVPMPEVYLLEQERGINAFAAGHNPANAAIGVTRGTLTTLNRSELQAVIAHEFSHILNGDMRLNVRLIGLLFGLLVIALIGRTVLRITTEARGYGGKKGGALLLAVILAVAVLVIGYVGLFCGRLIQAAVSRRRESLADASAVQFTRDSAGLRGALVKIAATSTGSGIAATQAEEVAHMLFAPGVKRFFATHPPILERIREVDARFDESEIDVVRARLLAGAPGSEAATGGGSPLPAGKGAGTSAAIPGAIAALVGNPGTAHLQLAREIRKSLPAPIVAAGQQPASARALLLALALDRNAAASARQKAFIVNQLGGDVAGQAAALQGAVGALEPEQRMPALLRSFPALRQLARAERMQLMGCLNGMLQREGHMSLHSYVLRKLVQVQLYDDLNPVTRPQRLPLSAIQQDAQTLFSVLARHGHDTDVAARRAYEAGMHALFPRDRPAYAVADNWTSRLDVALSRLDQAAPVVKEQLLDALLRTVTHDQQLTIGEAELLRAVCATLHCPLPPLVAGPTDENAIGEAAGAVRVNQDIG